MNLNYTQNKGEDNGKYNKTDTNCNLDAHTINNKSNSPPIQNQETLTKLNGINNLTYKLIERLNKRKPEEFITNVKPDQNKQQLRYELLNNNLI
jgi:hypothetical protein